MNDTIPRIQDYLSEHFRWSSRTLQFVRPKLGEDLKELFDVPDDDSAAALKLSIRLLALPPGRVIPFHRNPTKEKYFELCCGGVVKIIVQEPEGPQVFTLCQPAQGVIVNAGKWHAVHFVESGSDEEADPIYLRIIASSRENDVEWQDDIDELVLNRRLG